MEKESSEISQGRQMDSDSSNNTEMDSNTLVFGNDNNQEYNLAKETNEMDDNVVKEDSNQYSEHDEQLKRIARAISVEPIIRVKERINLPYKDPNYYPTESLVIFIRHHKYSKNYRILSSYVFQELRRRTVILIKKSLKFISETKISSGFNREEYLSLFEDCLHNWYIMLDGDDTYCEKVFHVAVYRLILSSTRKTMNNRHITFTSLDDPEEAIQLMCTRSRKHDSVVIAQETFTHLSQHLAKKYIETLYLNGSGYTAKECAEIRGISVAEYNNDLKLAKQKAAKLISLLYETKEDNNGNK